MRNAFYVFLYICSLIAATLIHNPGWIALALCFVLVGSGPGRLALLGRALAMVVSISVVVSGGYLIMQSLAGSIDWVYLVRFNTRIVLLALLTAWLLRDVDMDAALAPWPALRRWLTIVRGQILGFRELARDYKKAQRSRGGDQASLLRRYRYGAAVGLAALDKAMSRSRSLRDAMRSRGAMNG